LTLEDLGWTPRFAAAFEPYRAGGVSAARVSLEHTHIYRVISPDGEGLARVSGRLRHDASGRADFPAVGDWVVVEAADAGGEASASARTMSSASYGETLRIRAVLPRATHFSRRAAGNPTEEQVVAANIDVVFLVSGLDHDFNPRRIERYLVTAWESGAAPVIVLNKADLVEDPAAFVADVAGLAAGVPVHAVSAKNPESMTVLRAHLGPGRTAALLGSSGVGKSSIANALIGEELLRTREVRESDSRGRHTTTGRQLVLLPGGGILIDTPGMRELQLWDRGEPVAGAFADIESIGEGCRFRDCRHGGEPACAVTAAVAAGMLPEARLESYRKLQAEQEFQATQQEERGRLEVKRQGKIGAKALRKIVKDKGR
jgi:ribosome biogenesis GTPase / thiamine phosphate phosphatase